MKECPAKDNPAAFHAKLDKFWKWMDDTFTWYQQKIGNYDKQTWEESVEQRILNKLEGRPKNKIAKGRNVYNHTLIDVDVVGGAIYSKAKPQHGWLQTFYRGVKRVVLMPFCYDFWKQQTSPRIAKFMLFHYILQCLQLKLFYDCTGDTAYSEEVIVPVLLLISLGVLHAQIVSPHRSKISQQFVTATKSVASPKQHHRKRSRRSKPKQPEVERHFSSSEDCSSRRGDLKKEKDELNSSRGKETTSEPEDYTIVTTAAGADAPGRSGADVDDTGEEKEGGSSSDGKTTERKKMKLSVVNDTGLPDGTEGKSKIAKKKDFQNFMLAKNKKIPDPVDYQTASSASPLFTRYSRCNEFNVSLDTALIHKSTSPFSPAIRLRNRHSSERIPRQATDSAVTNGYHIYRSSETKTASDRNSESPSHKDDRRTRSHSPESVTSKAVLLSAEPCLRSFSVTGECPPDDSGIIGCDSGLSASFEVSVLSTDAGKSSSQLKMPQSVTGTLFVEDNNSIIGPQHKPNDFLFEQKPKCPIQRQSSMHPNSDSEDQRFINSQVTPSNEEVPVKDEPQLTEGNPAHAFTDGNSSTKKHKFTIGKYEPPETSEKPVITQNNEYEDTLNRNSKQKVQFEQLLRLQSVNSFETRGASANPADDSTGAETDNAAASTRYLGVRNSGQKSQTSETEYDRMNSDVGSCGTSSATEAGQAAGEGPRGHDNDAENTGEDPFVLWYKETHPSGYTYQHLSTTQTVSCYVWESSQLKKAELTLLDIGWSIIQAVERYEKDTIYTRLTFLTAFILSLNPLYYRIWTRRQYLASIPNYFKPMPSYTSILVDYPGFIIANLLGTDFLSIATFLLGILLRMSLYLTVAFLLCVAERIFEQRLQYAKHFCHLTSSRRAKKYILPHFRLNKVRNIKFWLSLRSYFKKRGPQRSVDNIITAAFYLIFSLLSVFCANILQDGRPIFDQLKNWDLILSPVVLSFFLLRFLTLGTKITKKYRNFSILITEQINLYLAMETKPHKKDDLVLANNVLKLAEELLKEVDGPFKVCGWSINPLVYNIVKIVVLSACSAVLSEFLGFKLKLYKIKINPTNW